MISWNLGCQLSAEHPLEKVKSYSSQWRSSIDLGLLDAPEQCCLERRSWCQGFISGHLFEGQQHFRV